jgi:hypothetical protein
VDLRDDPHGHSGLGSRQSGTLSSQPCSYDKYVVSRHPWRRTLFDKRGVKSDICAWDRARSCAVPAIIRHNRAMNLGQLPDGWVQWDLEPIEPGRRKGRDELLLGRGRLARLAVARRVLHRPAGSALRRRLFSSAIRGAYGLFNRGDMDFLAGGYTEDCHLDFEAFESVGLPRVVEGRAAATEYLNELRDLLELVYLPRLVIDPGGTTIAGMADFRTIGKSSGVELGAEHWNLWTLDGGLVARQRISTDRDSVLEEARAIAARY